MNKLKIASIFHWLSISAVFVTGIAVAVGQAGLLGPWGLVIVAVSQGIHTVVDELSKKETLIKATTLAVAASDNNIAQTAKVIAVAEKVGVPIPLPPIKT